MTEIKNACGIRVSKLLAILLACGLPLTCIAAESVAITEQIRLSEWLVKEINASQATANPSSTKNGLFLPGLIWQVPADSEIQTREKQRLLTYLQYWSGDAAPSKAARNGLVKLIASREVTGRVPLSNTDPRWLQANRKFDPVLEIGHRILIPQRPTTVTVIRENGTLCPVNYISGMEALHYIRACDSAASPDQAWIIQSDGTVQNVPVALWNRIAQDPPALGAWIWAPNRNSRWPSSVSTRIAAFFATQGVGQEPTDRIPTIQAQVDASTPPSQVRNLPITASDWGTVGLLQTPTARMAEQGHVSVTIVSANPYSWLNVMMQPFDWLEFGFRYMSINNRKYGPQDLSGNQSSKDKSIDFKLRLLEETAYRPQISLGMQDMGGTGLFSGEYLVASKRTGDFDWSLGIGWGYLGARGDFSNPFGWISDSLKTRPAGNDNRRAGGLNSNYFRGDIALFGGVQYHTPWDNLILKLEYEGNNYTKEPFSNNQTQRLPINLGAVWRITPNIDFSLGYERGNRAMLGFAFHGHLNKMSLPKLSDPPSLPVLPVSPRKIPDWRETAQDITAQTGWEVQSIRSIGSEVLVIFSDSQGAPYTRDHIERASAVLHRDAPASINYFRFAHVSKGMPIGEQTTRRAEWVALNTRPIPVSERREPIVSRPPVSVDTLEKRPEIWESQTSWLSGGVGLGYQQNLGGPDGFLLYQLSAVGEAELHLRRDTWLAGALQVGLFDNYSKFKYTAPSNLPRVRTYLREFLTASNVKIPFLQLTHTGKYGQDHYYSVYGGLLESMYAGIGAEWLYRPWGSPLAIGMDVNEVQQRGFDQNFSLRNYRTTTGHITAYWDTSWNGVQVNLSIGQYLAKDKGATLDVFKIFKNGVKMGAYATKTNLSAAQFGEGSFDKGIYITVPFDAFMTRSSIGTAALRWNPLTRDGGAKLVRQVQLYEMTNTSDPRDLWYSPAQPQR